MSKLDKLIKEYCPYGVEYLKIKQCVNDIKKIKWSNTDDMVYQYIDLSSVDINTHMVTHSIDITKDNHPSRAQQIVEKGDILFGTTRPMLKRFCMLESDYDGQICSTGFCVLRVKEKVVLPRWLYHNITSTNFFEHVEKFQKGASYPAISDKDLKKFAIPVPPLPVQEEIVRILDSFTSLTAELQDKLNTELQARKKQYEYYKVKLFQEARDIKHVTLDKISKNYDTMRKPVTSRNREAGNIPYYGASGIVDYVKDYIFDGDYLLISEDGANLIARSSPIAFSISGKAWVNNHAHVLQFDDYATRRYVEMYLNSIDLSYYITGAAQPKLSQKNLNKIEIPLPPLKEQQRIITILDRFDRLCNDLSTGLPAEIAARQKQYEYYRDKLLTFKELS